MSARRQFRCASVMPRGRLDPCSSLKAVASNARRRLEIDASERALLRCLMPKAQKRRLRVGVHTSIAGALENATRRAGEIGCDTFQMFSANPRGWRASDPTPQQCELFREDRENRKLSPLVIHDNYLINLAAADPEIRRKSIAAFRSELRRALALGAEYLDRKSVV